MDLSDYLPMFLAESREHLQELNLAVVRIEAEPDDLETRDEIFRIAHSLKGMSATMGFTHMAALTHELEDVFELLRRRSGGLGRDAVDAVLDCLDALGAAVDAIEAEGAERLDEAPLVQRLAALVRAEDRAPDDAPPDAVQPTVVGDQPSLVVRATLADDAQMPAARAYQLIEALRLLGDVVASVPAEDAVDAFDGRIVEIRLAGGVDAAAVEEAARAVADVARVELGEAAVPTEIVRTTATSTPHRGAGTVRVDASRLDQLMHLMGEVLVHRTHVESLAAQAQLPGLQQAMQELTRSSRALQTVVMQVRMVPVEAVFLRFPRVVRDLSSTLGKQVELVLSGKETELDRSVVDSLGDPVVHLVRNALDHGLEPPDERERLGKPPTGTLEISARHAGGSVAISVRDDGRGIDPARVAAKAVERGLLTEEAAATIDLQRAIELLFTPGFSTAEQTSDLSGRGVGLDAVRTAVRDLGGEVLVSSTLGAGTTAQIRMPLTLAIMAALVVESGGRPFAIPLDRVEQTLRLADHAVRPVGGRDMLVLRDAVLPLLDLGAALGYRSLDRPASAVVVRTLDHRLALAVGALDGQRELVTRPLPTELQAAALSGGAVLSNGEIALIVDCDRLTAPARSASALVTAA